MARGQGRTKVIQKQVDQDGMGDMFNQLLGDEKSLDIEIVRDKYNKLKTELEKIYKLLLSFKNSIYLKALKDTPGIDLYVKNLDGFVEDAKHIIPDTIEDDKLIRHYLTIKDNKIIKDCIHMCKNLIIYKKYIEDNENLSDSFIKSSKTKELQIFPFCNFDLKTIYYYKKIDESVKRYILVFLNMIYKASYEIYQIITSPDIDISKFSEVIVNSVKNAQKLIPRANKAFRKIEESVDMLKDNFNSYYKSFVVTRQPSCIIEEFIADVSRSESESENGVDMELAMQFKRIASFYRKKSQGKIKDPRISQIFELLDSNFAMLDIKEEETFDSDEEDTTEEIVAE